MSQKIEQPKVNDSSKDNITDKPSCCNDPNKVKTPCTETNKDKLPCTEPHKKYDYNY